MKSNLYNLLVILLVSALANGAEMPDIKDSLNTETGVVELKIAPVRIKDGGDLIISLYNDKDSWLKTDKAFNTKVLPVETDTVNVTLGDIPFGQYALSIIHDKNSNGKFDMRWFPFPKPKEGAGVSNNNRRMGKPDYDKALFTVAKDTTALFIEMDY